jgi:ubiquinone/menaquinone biosynthesis C-methylase UbiE
MDMQTRINRYWSKRAQEFSQCRLIDLASPQKARWLKLIKDNLPERDHAIRTLDVGTGAGFYAFLLSELGCKVKAIDYSEDMIDQAKENAKLLGYPPIEFLKMDAQDMAFENGSFDFIISRNVTWTLPNPEKAYGEWCRVLSPGGVIMNFDANYGHMFKVADETGATEKQNQKWEASDYKSIGTRPDMIRERNDIAKQLKICNAVRPQWDVDVLIRNGVSSVCVNVGIMERIFPGSAMSHNSSNNQDTEFPDMHMFLVKAVK